MTQFKNKTNSLKPLEIIAILLLVLSLLIFCFLLLQRTNELSSEGKINHLQLNSFSEEEKQQLFAFLDSINDEINLQNEILQNVLADSSKSLTDYMHSLESMNLAFLTWAEQQGLITRVN